MKTTVAALLAVTLASASPAFAAGCSTTAIDKNGKPLTGATKNSFMAKCEKDAKADCEKSAADKKLAGAAKTSYLNKCAKDGA